MVPAAGLHFILFFGSVRDPRNADRVAPYVIKAFEDRNVTVTVFDAKEMHFDSVIKPIQYYGRNETKPAELMKFNTEIKKADGFIVMTAEYHGQIAPGLLNLMNQFPPNSYVFRPSAIVAYSKGRFGGIRAAMQLRTYLADIGTLQMPAILSIPFVEQAFTVDAKTENADVNKSMNLLADQLIWYAEAIKLQREESGYRCEDCYDDNNLASKGLPYKNKKWSK
ncbi:NAD(P)H-dependent FMN reductase PA1204-like [Paramacrobiotus metropolitanus]|uniref:NAD(P)H-dependent FMN reductase PA1204-like n=1 Tax=Paramacrobiotus metropolitanus TaxID=2943436 RepID=UPI002445EB93|nr:NAD(P)H-dependent FMN reductase PA1204-like [Paramacrobiotus metropolitanus]